MELNDRADDSRLLTELTAAADDGREGLVGSGAAANVFLAARCGAANSDGLPAEALSDGMRSSFSGASRSTMG